MKLAMPLDQPAISRFVWQIARPLALYALAFYVFWDEFNLLRWLGVLGHISPLHFVQDRIVNIRTMGVTMAGFGFAIWAVFGAEWLRAARDRDYHPLVVTLAGILGLGIGLAALRADLALEAVHPVFTLGAIALPFVLAASLWPLPVSDSNTKDWMVVAGAVFLFVAMLTLQPTQPAFPDDDPQDVRDAWARSLGGEEYDWIVDYHRDAANVRQAVGRAEAVSPAIGRHFKMWRRIDHTEFDVAIEVTGTTGRVRCTFEGRIRQGKAGAWIADRGEGAQWNHQCERM